MFSNKSAPRSIWDEFNRLESEMDRLFDAYSTLSGAPDYPAINIWTNADGALITAELPGVEAKDVELSVVGETITLSGERQPMPELKDAGTRIHRQERGSGRFVRSIELPFPGQPDKGEARLEKGVLHIHAPRAESDRPKKISIHTA